MEKTKNDIPTIHFDMDSKCEECGNGGTLESGLCLKCLRKAIDGKKMKSTTGKMVQHHAARIFKKQRGRKTR